MVVRSDQVPDGRDQFERRGGEVRAEQRDDDADARGRDAVRARRGDHADPDDHEGQADQ